MSQRQFIWLLCCFSAKPSVAGTARMLTRLAKASGAPARRAAAVGDSDTLARLIAREEQDRMEPPSIEGRGPSRNGNNAASLGWCGRCDASGRTPLWHASFNGKKSCLIMLLGVLPLSAIEEGDNDGVSPSAAVYKSGNRS